MASQMRETLGRAAERHAEKIERTIARFIEQDSIFEMNEELAASVNYGTFSPREASEIERRVMVAFGWTLNPITGKWN
jgi:hypothetical protein